jgi:hypothetical protein
MYALFSAARVDEGLADGVNKVFHVPREILKTRFVLVFGNISL